MKYKSLFILISTMCFLQACNEPQAISLIKPANPEKYITTVYSKKTILIDEYNNTKGYWEDGQLITDFDCRDGRDFPPVNIKLWDKVSAVNGRLPSYEETKNGTAIHHYGEKQNTKVKPYNMILPKLAYRYNYVTKQKDILVLVIQIAQTNKDTVVGYRYLTGGCGGTTFSHFHFLNNEEVKKVIEL